MSEQPATTPATPPDALRSAVWSSGLRPHPKIVALAFADLADPDGTTCVSLGRVAEQTSLARSTVQKCVEVLRVDGWLVLLAPYRQHRANIYRVAEPGSAQLPVGTR
jgi:biotin operon repressor